MTGLLLIGLLLAWLALAAVISSWLTRHWRGRSSRALYALIAFAVLLPLPFVDEIVGKHQLRALCEEGAKPKYDKTKVRGKWVYSRRVPHPQLPSVMDIPTRMVPAWIPIIEQDISWVDKQTGEVLISYKAYEAKGGWLIRTLSISETDAPLTFEPRACRPNTVALFKELNVNAD